MTAPLHKLLTARNGRVEYVMAQWEPECVWHPKQVWPNYTPTVQVIGERKMTKEEKDVLHNVFLASQDEDAYP